MFAIDSTRWIRTVSEKHQRFFVVGDFPFSFGHPHILWTSNINAANETNKFPVLYPLGLPWPLNPYHIDGENNEKRTDKMARTWIHVHVYSCLCHIWRSTGNLKIRIIFMHKFFLHSFFNKFSEFYNFLNFLSLLLQTTKTVSTRELKKSSIEITFLLLGVLNIFLMLQSESCCSSVPFSIMKVLRQ